MMVESVDDRDVVEDDRDGVVVVVVEDDRDGVVAPMLLLSSMCT